MGYVERFQFGFSNSNLEYSTIPSEILIISKTSKIVRMKVSECLLTCWGPVNMSNLRRILRIRAGRGG